MDRDVERFTHFLFCLRGELYDERYKELSEFLYLVRRRQRRRLVVSISVNALLEFARPFLMVEILSSMSETVGEAPKVILLGINL